MKYVFLRALFLIVFVFQSTLTLTAAAAETAPDYADCPTVWCQYSVESVAVHRTLMSKLPEIERLDSKISGANFATAFFNEKLVVVGEGDSACRVFISNHIHNFEKVLLMIVTREELSKKASLVRRMLFGISKQL